MDKSLQDRVWACLPREFKEEVKEIYSNAITYHPCGYNHKTDLLKYLFGHHNLTSDAEGEEVLTCEKSKAMQLYSHLLDLVENERMSEHYSGWCDLEREYIALFGENVFADYFGSKCLPDETKQETKQETNSFQNGNTSNYSGNHFADVRKMVDTRLHIATNVLGDIIKSQYYSLSPDCQEENIPEMAKVSVQIADALIAECEKGGTK